MSDVSINIVSQFLGQKAFDKAGNSANKLASNVKRALIGVGFEEFARRSVNAFAANEKEMAGLSNTLKNLGLEMQNASVASYLDKLALATGALKSELVPAFQTLAVTTKDTADATTLLNLAMDISAGSTNSLDSVISALSKAYKGNVGGLGKLNVGLDKTILATGDLQEIVAYLSKTFSGQSKTAAETFANRVLRIKTAVEDAQEAFGKGLVDSLTILTNSESIDDLQKKIITFGTEAGEAFRKLAGFVKDNETALKNVAAILAGMFIGSKITAGIYVLIGGLEALSATMRILRNTAVGAYIAEMAVLNPLGGLAAAAGIVATIYGVTKSLDMLSNKFDEVGKKSINMGKNPIQSGTYLATTKKLVNYTKVLTAEELKQLKAKQLKLAIDKANLALGKGTDVFDLEKIQLNAALIGQAEALGKATTGAQILAIANDVQRLKVKQDILALEDAIASQDIKRIESATATLNADLKVLGTLQSQSFTILGIKGILDTLKPKSLIDQENLNIALDKIREMLRLLAQTQTSVVGGGKSTRAVSGIPEGDYVPPVVFDPSTSIDAVIEYADAATERATAFAILQEQENYAAYLSLIEFQKKLGDFGGYSADMNRGAGYGSGSTVTVEIVDKTSGLIEVVQNAVQENNRYGNNLTYAGAI
jgi:hypothetical protein